MSAAGDLELLVVGSGVAGLSAAVRASAAGLRVAVITKSDLAASATAWAQGGVAAVMAADEVDRKGGDDSPDLHAADTLQAGAGLCDRAAVALLVQEGPVRVRELALLGASFDRSATGRWELAREGGHRVPRVIHAGGTATGAEVERTLAAAAREGAFRIEENCAALDLIVEAGRCRGVIVARSDGTRDAVRADHTLLATGGAGQLYPVTTNPSEATGTGVAMALRAGVAVADVEFVQFHPTALHVSAGAGPRPLLSEALRGEGALLRNADGRRFVDELQPRDVVAAAIAGSIEGSRLDHVWLDMSPVVDFARRFPNLAAAVKRAGFDPATDWLPVSPAAHYLCGGVVTDLDGATTLPGLWAAGEVACSGVHGANRLASNSLLEGLVFAARAVDAVLRSKNQPDATGALAPVLDPEAEAEIGAELIGVPPPIVSGDTDDWGDADGRRSREGVQRAMVEGAGVVRDAESLAAAQSKLEAIAGHGPPEGEVLDMVTVARAIVAAAVARCESRGGHRRRDHPGADPRLSRRFVQW